jgi:hypothetical protein
MFFGVVAAVLYAGGAFAADPMANLLGNTIVATSSNGTERITYNKDHSMSGLNPKGEKLAGTWSVEDGKLCELPAAPPSWAAVGKHCVPVDTTRKVGDKWEYSQPNGEKVALELVKGR